MGATGPNSNCCITSAGVFIPRVFRGRAFSSAATSIKRPEVWTDRSVPFGKYWRRSPLDAPMFVKRLPGHRSGLFSAAASPLECAGRAGGRVRV